jgi:hypothetical protein
VVVAVAVGLVTMPVTAATAATGLHPAAAVVVAEPPETEAHQVPAGRAATASVSW